MVSTEVLEKIDESMLGNPVYMAWAWDAVAGWFRENVRWEHKPVKDMPAPTALPKKPKLSPAAIAIREAGYTVRKVAEYVGYDSYKFSMMIKGDYAIPREVVRKVADLIGCTYDEFIFLVEEGKNA